MERDLIQPATAKSPVRLVDLKELSRRVEVQFTLAMRLMREADFRLAERNADIDRRMAYLGDAAKEPKVKEAIAKEKKTVRDKIWSKQYEPKIREHIAEMRACASLLDETKRVMLDPKAVLSVAGGLGSARRAALLAEAQLMGPGALRNLAAVAISTRDIELAGVLQNLSDSRPLKDRFVDADFASQLVGNQVKEADGLIKDIEARDLWGLENWRCRERERAPSANLRIQYGLRFGDELPKETKLTEAELAAA